MTGIGQNKTVLVLPQTVCHSELSAVFFLSHFSRKWTLFAIPAKCQQPHYIFPLQQCAITKLIIIKTAWVWLLVLASQSHYLLWTIRCNHRVAWAAPVAALSAAAKQTTLKQLGKSKCSCSLLKWDGWGQQVWRAWLGTTKAHFIKHRGERNYYAMRARAGRMRDMREEWDLLVVGWGGMRWEHRLPWKWGLGSEATASTGSVVLSLSTCAKHICWIATDKDVLSWTEPRTFLWRDQKPLSAFLSHTCCSTSSPSHHHCFTAGRGSPLSVPFDQNAAFDSVQAWAFPRKGDATVARLMWSCFRSCARLHQPGASQSLPDHTLSPSNRTEVTWLLWKLWDTGTLPRLMSQLQVVMGSWCTSPSFLGVLVSEGWPGTRDRDRDVTYSSSSCSKCTGFTVNTQPGVKSHLLLKSRLFFPGHWWLKGNCRIHI